PVVSETDDRVQRRGSGTADRRLLWYSCRMISRFLESIRQTQKTLELAWRSSPSSLVGIALLTLVPALLPLAIAYAGKLIIDPVVARSVELATQYVLLELGLVTLQAVVQRGLSLLRSLLGARLGLDVNVAILQKALQLALPQFENPEFYDRLTRARREAS